MFYVLRVIYHSEPFEIDSPKVPNEAFVFFQDRLPEACGDVDLVVEERFRETMGEDLEDDDEITVVSVVSDPLTLRVLKAWDRTAIDGPAGMFNLGTP